MSIRDNYRVVEMVNGDYRVQKRIDHNMWVTKQDSFEFVTAASALNNMEKCIIADQELVDSQTVKRVVK